MLFNHKNLGIYTFLTVQVQLHNGKRLQAYHHRHCNRIEFEQDQAIHLLFGMVEHRHHQTPSPNND
jgi:hypothetical protein